MDLFPNASDDAIALACCCGALLLSSGIMFFSRYLNPAEAQAADVAQTPNLRLTRSSQPVPKTSELAPAQERAA